MLFEHLRRWSDARRAHEAAGAWAQAAHCYRQDHGDPGAARSPEYGRWLVQAQRVDDLVQLYLGELDRQPGDRAVQDRLRWLVREHESQIQSPHLRDAAAERLARVVDAGLRERFDRGVAGWIAKARAEIDRRYCRVWGMDLGTSKSAVAVFDLTRGAAVICPHKGQPHFPSTLALDRAGNELVGLSALDQLRPDLRGCIEGSKRAMGTRRVYRIGDRHFSPEEVAARLLIHGRSLAEAFLRDEVRKRVLALARDSLGDDCQAEWLDGPAWTDQLAFALPEAVVTIPAYFNFDQRRATRDAAEIAGIKVQRLVPEPTAACLSAGLARQLPGKMLVVDLGAGTLDLSYLEATYLDKGEGFFEVARIFGDSQFGSSDFDAVIEKHFAGALEQAGRELRGLDRRRLHAAAEQIKIALSSSPTATDELVAFAGQPRCTLERTAVRLEQLLAPLLERLETVCRQAAVAVQVFQGLGDSTDPAAASRLAVVHLDGIPPAKAGEPKIDVAFNIDANGLLEVTATDEKTGRSRSLRIEDATWLSPSERADMTSRLSLRQRWARARGELTALVRQIDGAVAKLAELERRGAAQLWERHFAAWQRTDQGPPGPLDPGDDALLAEMYNTGQTTCDRSLLAIDRARNLRSRHERFAEAASKLDGSGSEADGEKALRELAEQGQALEAQLRDALATLEPLELTFRRWSTVLARASALRADPRDRFAIHHDAGDWQRALDAYHQAFDPAPTSDVPIQAVCRRLDTLARLGRRDVYRQVLAEQRGRLALRDLQFGQLNEFGRYVSPAIAWVFVSGRGTGSGFLAAPDLVVTNRHVITDPDRPTPAESIVVQVGAAPRSVARVRFPFSAEIDLAVLELTQPLEACPVRVGYTGLVEIGERVLAIGFPLPEGDSFEDNLLLDHGIVNRIRTRPDRHGRELELGLRVSPGMSGGPVFNDRGEVVAVTTFVRYQTSGGGPQPAQPAFIDKSSHAIALDALHDLLPRPW